MKLLFVLAVFTNTMNTLGLYWLTRRVNRRLYRPRAVVNREEPESTLSDFQKGIKDFAKW